MAVKFSSSTGRKVVNLPNKTWLRVPRKKQIPFTITSYTKFSDEAMAFTSSNFESYKR